MKSNFIGYFKNFFVCLSMVFCRYKDLLIQRRNNFLFLLPVKKKQTVKATRKEKGYFPDRIDLFLSEKYERKAGDFEIQKNTICCSFLFCNDFRYSRCFFRLL